MTKQTNQTDFQHILPQPLRLKPVPMHRQVMRGNTGLYPLGYLADWWMVPLDLRVPISTRQYSSLTGGTYGSCSSTGDHIILYQRNFFSIWTRSCPMGLLFPLASHWRMNGHLLIILRLPRSTHEWTQWKCFDVWPPHQISTYVSEGLMPLLQLLSIHQVDDIWQEVWSLNQVDPSRMSSMPHICEILDLMGLCRGGVGWWLFTAPPPLTLTVGTWIYGWEAVCSPFSVKGIQSR